MKLDEDSKQAFAALTARYIDLVYSAALRQVQDQHVAEDVTQAVFIVLARKISSLHQDRPLGPWLLQTTKYVASNARRGRLKRQHHERRAALMAQHIDGNRSRDSSPLSEWNELSPLLDEGISRMPGKYRQALVMRYFETMSLQEVGRALGISEAAAAKRVSRAVEKLRHFFKSNGVAVGSSAALSTILSVHLTQSAPVSLAATVTTGATNHVAASSAAATLAKGAIFMAITEKLKVAAIACAVLLLSAGAALIVVNSTRHDAPLASSGTASQPSMTAGANNGSPLDIPFTGGTLTILGISDEPWNLQRWWLPDGSKLNESPGGFTWRQQRLNSLPDQRTLYLVLNLTGSDISNPMVEFDLGGGKSTGNARMAGNSPKRTLSMSLEAPVDLPMTDATLRIASGDWKVQAEYDQVSGRFSPQVPEVTIKSITDDEDRTSIALHYQTPPGSKVDWLISILTQDGKKVGMSERQTIGTDGDQILKYRCRLEDVKQVIYESRPFEERLLNHISIDPIAQTKPVLVANNASSMMTSRPAP